MPKVTPEQGADKLISRAKAATSTLADQIRKVTVSPTQTAADNIDKMRANFNAAIDSGKVERGLRRVSLQDWQKAMIERGIPRIASGLDASRGKIVEFNRQFYPFLERVQAEVAAMPNLTLDDNINRMVHNVREIAKFKRQ
ncbi:MAG: hypothetical protein KKF27_20230 [Gammaproteobacteria bacterium]|nr:hypothetical protein [Gammaproteobacteria bacterium]